MKAQFLKMAGVKTEKEFYKKFPTEKAFMAKHGKKIKAFGGMNMGGGGVSTAGGSYNGIDFNTVNGQDVSGTYSPMGGGGGGMDFMQGMNIVGGVAGGIRALGAEKEARKKANQTRQVLGVQEQAVASNTNELQQLEVSDARQKAVVNPWDNVITGEELFPINGVGTNVLAARKGITMKYQNGGTHKMPDGTMMKNSDMRYGGKIKAQGGADFGYLTDSAINSYAQNSGGQQIGGAIGGAFGPVGKFAGQILGDAVFSAGNRRKTMNYNDSSRSSVNNIMGMNAGGYFQNQFNLKDGGTMKYADGGNIQMLGEGSLSPISENPYGGQMNMINGPSHANGGTDMIVNGQPVEAEPEPIYETSEGDQTIAGNLKVPSHIKKSAEAFTGMKLSGDKFKSVIKSLGKAEDKQNKTIDNNVGQADKYTPLRPLDRISLNTLDTNIKIADDKLKKFQIIKDGFADIQDVLNGEEESARYGKKIKAQEGTTITSAEKQSYLDRGYQVDENNPNRLYKDGTAAVHIKGVDTIEEGVERVQTPGIAPIKDPYDGSGGYASNEKWTKFMNSPASKNYREKYIDGIPGTVSEIETQGLQGFDSFDIDGTPGDEVFINDPVTGKPIKKKFDLTGALSYLPSLFQNSDAERFDNRALFPEINALVNNRLEAVQSQKYQPSLDVPYDQSLQDIRNQNQSDYRTQLRMLQNNPELTANAQAQKYSANQRVTGEEFRLNQAKKDEVYSKNRTILNDAQLKNLAIADTQYVRQSQAKSNTKATQQSALNSMSDKISKQALENKTLRVWENMYDYRYDKGYKSHYQGPPINVDAMQELADSGFGNQRGVDETYRNTNYKYDPQTGERIQRNTTSGKIPSTATNPYFGKNGMLVKSYKKFK